MIPLRSPVRKPRTRQSAAPIRVSGAGPKLGRGRRCVGSIPKPNPTCTPAARPPEPKRQEARANRTGSGFLSGGGGSRTRVRIWVQQSLYVRRTLLISPRGVSDRPLRNQSPTISISDAVTKPEAQPELSSLQGPPRAGNPRNGPVRKLTRPVPCCCWQLKSFPKIYEGRETSARYSTFTRHVETVTPPVYVLSYYTNPQVAVHCPGWAGLRNGRITRRETAFPDEP